MCLPPIRSQTRQRSRHHAQGLPARLVMRVFNQNFPKTTKSCRRTMKTSSKWLNRTKQVQTKSLYLTRKDQKPSRQCRFSRAYSTVQSVKEASTGSSILNALSKSNSPTATQSAMIEKSRVIFSILLFVHLRIPLSSTESPAPWTVSTETIALKLSLTLYLPLGRVLASATLWLDV